MPETPTHDPIRAMLDERSRDLELDTSLPASVARRSRRRRWMTGAVAGAGATAAVFAAILVLNAATQPGPDVLDTPEPTVSVPPGPTPTGSATESEPPPPADIPATYVAVDLDGRLVRVDTQTGDVVEALLPGERIDGPIAVAADGVYLQDEWLPRIYFLPFGSTELQHVVDGISPAVSPDGARLAFGRLSDDPPAECTEFCTDLVIRDLASGEEVVWSHGEDVTQISFIAWLPGDRIAASVSPFGDGDTVVKVVGASEGGSLDLIDPIMQPELDGPNWHVVGYHEPTGGLIVNETCCFYGEDAPAYAVRAVNPDTGEVLATLAESATWVAGNVDATGGSVLLRFQSASDGSISKMVVIGSDESRTNVAPTQASWISW